MIFRIHLITLWNLTVVVANLKPELKGLAASLLLSQSVPAASEKKSWSSPKHFR
jgi:hypothetical protein